MNEDNDKPVIRKFLDLSTWNMTKEDSEILETEPEHLHMWNYEGGFFIWGGPRNDGEERGDFKEELKHLGLSDAFIKVIEYAHEQDCSYIMFDRDGELNFNLETFEW